MPRSRTRSGRFAFLVLVVVLVCFRPDPAAGDDLGDRVNRALDRAARNLIERQAPDGSWQKEDKVHPLGRTALCTFALLHEGFGADDEPVKRALGFLGIARGYASKIEAQSTYEAGCLLLMLNALGKGYEPDIQSLCAWLCEHYDMGSGLWGYPDGTRDLSNTQYAAMGLKVGEGHGFRAPRSLWSKLLETMPTLQAEEGGIRYRPGTLYRASMTHAALLVVDYARDSLGMKRLPRDVRQAVGLSRRWLEEHFDVQRHPFGRGWVQGHYFYYMYGLERYAMHFGLERVAGHDWYREGAEALLGRQQKNGSWGSLEDTCFAILFLRRATLAPPAPVTGRARARPDAAEPAKAPVAPPTPRPQAELAFQRAWLVAGPYRDVPGEDWMLTRKHFDVRRTSLREGGDAGESRWARHVSAEDKIDFRVGNDGEQPPWCCWYAGVWLHADEDQTIWLWFGSDDGFRCYLNGKQVFEGHHHDYCGDDHYRVALPLTKGANALVLQVENATYYCHMKARFSDADGAAPTNVRVSLARRERR